MTGKPQLHPSALEMKCFEQIRRRYVEREIIPPGILQIIGTGTHRSIEKDLSNKIATGLLLETDAIEQEARDGVNNAWEGGVRLDPDEAQKSLKALRGEAVDKAVRLARLHHSDLATVINPIQVERSWALRLDGYPVDLAGRIDIQEPSAVRDTKTSGKTPAPDAAMRSLQLKAYHLAVKILDGIAPETVALDYLVDGKLPKAMTLNTTIGDEDYAVLLARIEILCKAMEAGIFPPVEPTHWCCNPKWCGYALTCRYYLNKPVQIAVNA